MWSKQITHNIFTELEQIFLKFISNHERPRIPTVIPTKNNKAGGIILLDFGQYYEVTSSKQCGIGTKTARWLIEWIENTEINSYTYGQLIFDKVVKNI